MDYKIRFALCRYRDAIEKLVILRETPKRFYVKSEYYRSGEIIRKDDDGQPVKAMYLSWVDAHMALQKRIADEIAKAAATGAERMRALKKVRRMKKGTVES